MSTVQAAAGVRVTPKHTPNPARDSRFFLGMAIACAVGVFVGFSRSFYLRTYFGGRSLSLLFEIHGAVFTAWMIYLVAQTALVADRRITMHRRFGYAGAVLASAMAALGVGVSYSAAKYGFALPIPFAHNPEGGLFFSFVEILTFAAFVAAGFYFRRNRQVHQRLMLMSTVCALLPSALGRLSPMINPTPLIFLFVLAGPIYDLLTLRRIHRAYLWSLLLFVLTVPPIRMLAGNSATWYRFAHWLLS